MARPDWLGLSFREWLIDRLAATSHARLIIDDEGKLARVATSLGVQPDTLSEAMVVYRMKRIEDGRTVPMGEKRSGSGHFQLRVWFPPGLMPIWKAECEHRHMTASVLIRSVVHDYLLGDKEPFSQMQQWIVRGKSYQSTNKNRVEQRALIPPGARTALSRRAASFGLTSSNIMRALLCEVLEGKHMGVRAVDSAAMYDDPNRYNQGKTGQNGVSAA